MKGMEIALVAGLLLAYALVSGRVARSSVTPPMIFIAAGVLFGPQALGVLELGLDDSAVLLLAESTLAIVLFSDAARLDVRRLRHEVALPARLLGIGLPLTVGVQLAGVLLVLPDLSWQEAGLLAAILAPTDAALGQAVMSDQRVPARIRQTLNVESGLNDGLAVPAVTIFLSLADPMGESRSGVEWFEFAARQIGYGALFGLGVGAAASFLLCRAKSAGWLEGIAAQLAGLATPAAAFALAVETDGNGFIAAFTAGLAFKAIGNQTAEHFTEYAEDTGQLFALVAFLVFGNVLVGPLLGELTFPIALCAIGALTVGRMVPVGLALLGSGLQRPTVLFMGWFGPRGLASILFALTVLEGSALAFADEVFAVVAWTVLMSVVAHGLTARWGAQKYADWYDALHVQAGNEEAGMAEEMPMTEHRPRGVRARR